MGSFECLNGTALQLASKAVVKELLYQKFNKDLIKTGNNGISSS